MRRGMGLADIMLYIFVLFLVLITLAITVLGSQSDSPITVIDIGSDDAKQMLATSIVSRSVLETLPAVEVQGSVGGIDYAGFSIDQHEFLGFAATYVHTSEKREESDLRDSAWFQPRLRKGMFDVELYQLTQTSPDDPIGRNYVYTESFGVTSSGPVSFRVGPDTGMPIDVVMVWVPGYVGESRVTRGLLAYLNVPEEVMIDES